MRPDKVQHTSFSTITIPRKQRGSFTTPNQWQDLLLFGKSIQFCCIWIPQSRGHFRFKLGVWKSLSSTKSRTCGVCLLFTRHTTTNYVIWATSVQLSDTACASTPPSRMSDLYMLCDQIITGWPATPNVCQSSRPCHCVRQLMMNPSTFVIPSKASSKQRTKLSHLQSIQTNFQYTCNNCDD